MKLSIKERLMLPTIMPLEGNLQEQMSVKVIKEKALISKEEEKAIKYKAGNEGINWDEKLAVDKEIDLNPAEIILLKSAVDTLDKNNKVTQNNLSLCIKIKSL